ncbi:MAG TPA: MlaD family protein [Rhizomicrobium sp.]|jgi:phospholipid/cholesterol/gamma-HCH transport system substrate-binding protein|nr:MlaD family protein [Rhizomicrobium sp.]
METKANYVAVGAFVLACVIGLVVTIMWLAGVQYSQEYAYYEAFFKGPVTGLGKGTVTRYNGIEVGRITNLEFDPSDPQRVIVTMQVQPNLNIRDDSVASIESQGLTGGSYVEISGGTAKAPLLVAQDDQRYPVIKTKQSTFAQLEQSAPEVVAKLDIAASRLNDLLNDDNRRSIAHILGNLDETTQVIARRSADIDATIANANKTMANFNQASQSIKPTLEQIDLTVQKYGKVANDADAFINGDGLAQLSDLIGEARRLVGSLDQFSDQLNRQPTKLLFGDRRKGYEPK